MTAEPPTPRGRGFPRRDRGLARRFATGALAAALVLALAAGLACGRPSRAPRQAASDPAAAMTFVVVGLQPPPSQRLGLRFTGGFTAINLVSAAAAPEKPGIGLFAFEGGDLLMQAQGGQTAVEVDVNFELAAPGTPITGEASVPSGTGVAVQTQGGNFIPISGHFSIPTGTQLGASPQPHLAAFPRRVRRGGAVALAGSVAGRCAARARVTLISKAFTRRHRFAGVPAVRTAVKPGGLFATLATVRRTAPAGRYRITARCGGRSLGVVAHLRVRR